MKKQFKSFITLMITLMSIVSYGQTGKELYENGAVLYKLVGAEQEAVNYFKQAAAKGYVEAEFALGLCYEEGKGVTKNKKEAAKWFKTAATHGNAKAQLAIGICYSNGDGVGKSYTEAVKWYRKAADAGLAEAQVAMGICYSKGQGIKKNPTEAVKYYTLAANQGNVRAQLLLGLMYYAGKEITQDYTKAAEMLQNVVYKGEKEQVTLAALPMFDMYIHGKGVQKNDDRAIDMYVKATDVERKQAIFEIATMYHEGQMLEQDYEQSVLWTKKAAENGFMPAQEIIGNMYYMGEYFTLDYEDAIYWWLQASNQGSELAKANLKAINEMMNSDPYYHGMFSVSHNTKVNFSPGNLQYQASTNTWRFAENQWDYVGNNNWYISPDYDGWIDLFGWGTGNEPTKCINKDTYYRFYDWGRNTISNGGNRAWRTLNSDEYVFLFNNRTTVSGIRYAMATVNGKNGLIVFPDNWRSENYSLNRVNDCGAKFSDNNISLSDWETIFEANGAVFLPAAGRRRDGTRVDRVGTYGAYWGSTPGDTNWGQILEFYDNNRWKLYGQMYCRTGLSVRLVCPVEPRK